MTLTAALTDRVIRAYPHATRILLGPAQYLEFLHDMAGLMRFAPTGAGCGWRFMGLPVVLDLPGEFCRNCGAPSEPDICSYCQTASTTITLVSRETT